MKILFVLSIAVSISALAADPEWKYQKIDNPLQGKSYDQFVLIGTYVTAPTLKSADAQPRIVIECERKLKSAYVDVGTLVERTGVAETGFLSSGSGTRVELRWDDKKSPDKASWEISNDGHAAFMRNSTGDMKAELTKVLTGSPYAKRNTLDPKNLIRNLYVGILEAAGNQVIMHFEMPRDASQIAEKCDLK